MTDLTAQSMGRSFGTTEVLKGATLWARSGRVGALIGRNGCGKSTLLKLTMGLLRADYGAVHFGDFVTERPRPAPMAERGVFYLPQEGLLSRRYTLRVHLDFFARRWAGDLEAAAGTMGVAHVLDQRPHQISGGETRRAELAMALLRRPTVLLTDEPLKGVTPADRDAIGSAIRALAAEGTAVIVTGHDAPELFSLSDDVTWLAAGTTHDLGSPVVALEHHQFVQEYLGPGGRDAVRRQLELDERV